MQVSKAKISITESLSHSSVTDRCGAHVYFPVLRWQHAHIQKFLSVNEQLSNIRMNELH